MPAPATIQWTRRLVLQAAMASAISPALARRLLAQAEPTTLNRFPRMLHEFYVDQLRAAEDAGRKRRAMVTSAESAREYVAFVRGKIQESFGPFPEKTPLKPRVTGSVDRPDYRIEKVIFESRPNFPVTANLYLPTRREFPVPGVVGSCGHSANGKAIEAYQSFCQGLARLGYACLIFDPIGQGERSQYPDEHGDHSRIGIGVLEHLYAGNQQFLVDEFFGSWRAWDGIRALDYLLTRPEVDPNHIGITGNSGGGTMTTWLCGLESRWTMATPSCFVTTFRRNLENELPADTEQCPPGIIAAGLDHVDFLAAMAPKPVIMLAQERDFFDVRGTLEAFEELKRIYRALGVEDKVRLFIGPGPHGYARDAREAMYSFFNQQTGLGDAVTEPEITVETDADLQCTKTGQVTELSPRTVSSFTQERSREFAASRPSKTGADLASALRESLSLPAESKHLDYRILRPLPSRDFTTYAVETEPDMHAIVYRLGSRSHVSRPVGNGQPCILYLPHHSSDDDLKNEPLVAELRKEFANVPFYLCDVRGIGESRPNTCGQDSYFTPYGSDYFYAVHGIMLDRPLPGQRTHDVLAVIDWLISAGHPDVHLVARGWSSLPGAFAAALSDRVTRVTLKNALVSYAALAENETYAWPLSSFVPGVLRDWDLSDVYVALESKNLTRIDFWNEQQQTPG